jgi:O-antigen ligase
LVIFLLINMYGDLVKTRSSSEARLENKSISERVLYLNDFKEVVKNNWLFGTGIGNYSLAVKKIHPGEPIYRYQPVHNVFLLVWAETGLLGILSFLAFLFFCFFATAKRIEETGHFFTGISVLSALIIIMLFDHWLWSLHFGIILLFFTIGSVYREDGKF